MRLSKIQEKGRSTSYNVYVVCSITMSHHKSDPLEYLIADGKIGIMPDPHCSTVIECNIDLDELQIVLVDRLFEAYGDNFTIRYHYNGDDDTVTINIKKDIGNYVDLALAVAYNRMRKVLETHAYQVHIKKMNVRAPVYDDLKFPTFLASTLGSIGPLRVTDALRDCLLVYVTTESKMTTYGRERVPGLNMMHYDRFHGALRTVGIQMSTIIPTVFHPSYYDRGAFYTTFVSVLYDDLWNLRPSFHPSHYQNEDVARYFLTHNKKHRSHFEDVSIMIDYMGDEHTVEALCSVRGRARYVGGCYLIDTATGIQPECSSGRTTYKEGFYVLGRGDNQAGRLSYARHVSEVMVRDVTRYRLYKGLA